MCLAVPGKIIEINKSGEEGVVEILGVSRNVVLTTLDDTVKVGDYILLHAGFGIRKVNLDEAMKAIKLHEQAIQNQR